MLMDGRTQQPPGAVPRNILPGISLHQQTDSSLRIHHQVFTLTLRYNKVNFGLSGRFIIRNNYSLLLRRVYGYIPTRRWKGTRSRPMPEPKPEKTRSFEKHPRIIKSLFHVNKG